MWSLVVVNLDEFIEAFLLLQEVEGGGLCRFLLQCQMHAFMAAVLLRISGFDALYLNTKA